MTIDHTKPENYRLRNGYEVVRMIPTPEHHNPHYRLLILYRDSDGEVNGVATNENGRALALSDSPYDLIPHDHDPVLWYANVFERGPGQGYRALDSVIFGCSRDAIARIACHKSGRVRQIPLNWTEDKEATP